MIPNNFSSLSGNKNDYLTNLSFTSLCGNNSNNDNLSDEMRYFILVFRICFCPLLSAWSVITGIVNIIVFHQMGLRDGLNQNFLILSVADALQGVFSLGKHICYVLNWFGLCFGSISFRTLLTVFGVANNFALNLSNTTTTIIAVIRCCCVTMPFALQQTLTARRQLAAILISSGVSIATLIYALIVNKFENLFKKGEVSVVWDVVTVAQSSAYLIIIFSSMIILIRAVIKSSRGPQREVTPGPSITSDTRSVRDTRIVVRVFLVLAIFAVCNVLIIPIATLRLFIPELRYAILTNDKFLYLTTLRATFLGINTSLNIFVYYFNDLRFKKVVNKLFHKHEQRV